MSSLILINDKNRGDIERYGKSPLTRSEVINFANKSKRKRSLEDDRLHVTEAKKRLTMH